MEKNERTKENEKKSTTGKAETNRQNGKNKVKLNTNNLTKLLAVAVALLGLAIIGGYLRYFLSLENLTEKNDAQKNDPAISMPVMPYKAYSIKKADLIAKFGEGTAQGEGVSQETKYIDYTQNWFDIEVNARYYYGKENRVYETILSYEAKDKDKVYQNMKKAFGETLIDTYYDESAKRRTAFWIKDSVNIFLRFKEGKPEVEMHTSYYENPDNYDLGYRPTVIQQINVDVTGDGQKNEVMLIGTKPVYTTTVYKNLFLFVENGEDDFYARFPKETDGGESPKMEMVDVDKDGKKEFLIQADQDYVMNYNVFKIEGTKITNTYSSDVNPLDKKSGK